MVRSGYVSRDERADRTIVELKQVLRIQAGWQLGKC